MKDIEILELFKATVREDLKGGCSFLSGFCLLDLSNNSRSLPVAVPAEIGSFELIKVYPGKEVTRLAYKYKKTW